MAPNVETISTSSAFLITLRGGGGGFSNTKSETDGSRRTVEWNGSEWLLWQVERGTTESKPKSWFANLDSLAVSFFVFHVFKPSLGRKSSVKGWYSGGVGGIVSTGSVDAHGSCCSVGLRQ